MFYCKIDSHLENDYIQIFLLLHSGIQNVMLNSNIILRNRGGNWVKKYLILFKFLCRNKGEPAVKFIIYLKSKYYTYKKPTSSCLFPIWTCCKSNSELSIPKQRPATNEFTFLRFVSSPRCIIIDSVKIVRS